jgi:DNA-binding IclR family transcriptional regulator
VSEIAQRVGLPKSTVSRLLATLSEIGAVTHDASGYDLGPLLTELATSGRHDGLVAIARPYLAALVEAFGEDAGIAVLDHGDTLYLDQYSADTEVQVRDWTGERAPPHAVSSGLVLLAHAPADERERVLAAPLARLTPRTMVAPAKLRHRLADVARRGSAWVYGEFAGDLNSVAAPVLGPGDVALAALHVHGPSYRFPGERDPDQIAATVSETAERMSARFQR